MLQDTVENIENIIDQSNGEKFDQINELVKRILSIKTPRKLLRARKVFLMRYINGYSITKIAQHFKVTRQRINQIIFSYTTFLRNNRDYYSWYENFTEIHNNTHPYTNNELFRQNASKA